ncbi:MAG: hypothetical protein HZA50_01935 [Planctomycetes bacterium]|nr:hypothetical protein [Planctomycetota bacterium]
MLTIDRETIQEFLRQKVAAMAQEPEFARHEPEGRTAFMRDADGLPAARVAIANAAPSTDIWAGLRSPAAVGSHPVGVKDIWNFYAANNIKSVRNDGTPNYLAVPESFEEACEHLRRVVIISALLPISPEVFAEYAAQIEAGRMESCDQYARASGEVGKMAAKMTARLAMALAGKGRHVVSMDPAGADKVAKFTRSESQSGRYHGPCNNPWPQNSVAVLTGLMQFGLSRIPMRDEIGPDGRAIRMMGHYASVVLFDETPPVPDGAGGIVRLDAAWIEGRKRLNNPTVVDRETLSGRFCGYSGSLNGKSPCGLCMKICPAGAIANSSPMPDGKYPERLLGQKHRFNQGFLDFDFGSCSNDRGQKQNLYSEYACARCVAVCAAMGVSGLRQDQKKNPQ